MAGLSGIVLNFTAKTADATRDIGKLDKKLGGLGGSAKKAGGGIGSALGSLGKIGTSLPVIGTAVAGVVGLGAAFTGMAKAAYEDANAQAKLERNLRRIPGVTKKAASATGDWVDEMELLTLISDDKLRRALSKLAGVTGDVTKAQKLAVIAWDASVASGKEFESVASALAKAAAGNTAAIKRMFPELKAGKDDVLSYAEAIDQLTKKYSGAAEAAAKKDVFGRIGVAFNQIGEAIGTAALPLLESISAWFSDKTNIENIQGWITKLETWATTIGEDIRGKVQEFVTWLKSDEGKQAVKDITEAVKDLGTALETVVGWLADFKVGMQWLIDHMPGGKDGKWADDPRNFFTPKGGGLAPEAPGSHLNPDQNSGGRPKVPRNAAAGYSGGGVVININNPKPERASTSVAAGLRVSRTNTGVWT